jgi:hypothetical protein
MKVFFILTHKKLLQSKFDGLNLQIVFSILFLTKYFTVDLAYEK